MGRFLTRLWCAFCCLPYYLKRPSGLRTQGGAGPRQAGGPRTQGAGARRAGGLRTQGGAGPRRAGGLRTIHRFR